MSNALSRPIPAPAGVPRLPAEAEAALLRLRGGASTEPLPDHVRQAARDALTAIEHRLAPADAATWLRFLVPLAGMVRNPPSVEEIKRFASACASVMQDIPAACLTATNQRAAGREFSFWPAVADIAKLLEVDAAALRADARALRRMAEAPLLSMPFRDEETPEEKVAYAEQRRQTVATLKAEMEAKERAARPSAGQLKPAYLSRTQLVQEYRRIGQHATADAIERHHGLRSGATA